MEYSRYTSGIMPLYMVQQPPFTIDVPGAQAAPGETVPRRNPKARNGLVERPSPDVGTLFELLQRSARRFPSEPAIGSRKLLNIHKEVKKVNKVVDGEVRKVDKEWAFFELSSYSYQTYGEFANRALLVGSGLRHLGLVKNDKVHIFAGTCAEWQIMAHGCSTQSMTIVTAYDTLGALGVQHSLVQSGAVAMFIDPHLLPTATRPLQAADSVRFVIYNAASHQPVAQSVLDDFRKALPKVKLLSFEELTELGASSDGQPVAAPVPPDPADLFCIMYTSGSTGLPKGVPVTHASFVAAVAGLNSSVEEVVSPRDRILAYLPLAHIFELVLENLVLFVGGTLGYGSPRSLTDISMQKGCPSDLRAFAPTILVGVPQVWESVRKGVTSGVEQAGPVAKALFWGYYELKNALVAANLLVGPMAAACAYLDSIVFKRVRTTTGGNLRFIVNGASGIANDTQHFLSLVVAPMICGYGLTETTANGALGSPLQWTSTAIGPIAATIEVKLVSQLDLGYDANPAPGSDQDPHGEILMRGNTVLKEYYKNPEETQQNITPDGWFRTGDIGAFDRVTGHLRVVDRLKNLVKMQGGEYVALEKLEAVYRGAAPVQNLMVYADSYHTRPVAVVWANEKALAELAAKVGVTAENSGGVVAVHHHPQVKAEVLKALISEGKKAGLTSIELVQGVVVVDDEWTPANGLVTATQKVNRRALKDKYMADITKCFGQ